MTFSWPCDPFWRGRDRCAKFCCACVWWGGLLALCFWQALFWRGWSFHLFPLLGGKDLENGDSFRPFQLSWSDTQPELRTDGSLYY